MGNIVKLLFSIDNAYPSYRAEAEVVVKNTGTISVELVYYFIESSNISSIDVSVEIP